MKSCFFSIKLIIDFIELSVHFQGFHKENFIELFVVVDEYVVSSQMDIRHLIPL